MAARKRAQEDVLADEEFVGAYINYIISRKKESGLFREIKRIFDQYMLEKQDRVLRLLAKEVRVIVRDTFSGSERDELESDINNVGALDMEIVAILRRGSIRTDEEFAILEAYVDELTREGRCDDIGLINNMLSAYEAGKREALDK